MLQEKIITEEELSAYGPVDNLNEQAIALVRQQREAWGLAGNNYAALDRVQSRIFDYGHFQIHVHHNPGRMRSSAAITDAKTIAQRPCFLCTQNLPPEQKGILFGDDYLILANPFPIFPVHLTIPHQEHIPQRLEHFFSDMLDLSRNLSGFTVFYNGPRCGASAPDHFHFQAGNRGFLRIEKEFDSLKQEHAKAYIQKNELEVFAVENYLRRFLAIVSPEKKAIIDAFGFIYSLLSKGSPEEPMLNVLAWHAEEKWHVVIFPRERQRPSHFFESGTNQIIVGPAAVEMGGILILPRDEDFERIDNEIISDIYNEVTLSASSFKHLIEEIEKHT